MEVVSWNISLLSNTWVKGSNPNPALIQCSFERHSSAFPTVHIGVNGLPGNCFDDNNCKTLKKNNTDFDEASLCN